MRLQRHLQKLLLKHLQKPPLKHLQKLPLRHHPRRRRQRHRSAAAIVQSLPALPWPRTAVAPRAVVARGAAAVAVVVVVVADADRVVAVVGVAGPAADAMIGIRARRNSSRT